MEHVKGGYIKALPGDYRQRIEHVSPGIWNAARGEVALTKKIRWAADWMRDHNNGKVPTQKQTYDTPGALIPNIGTFCTNLKHSKNVTAEQRQILTDVCPTFFETKKRKRE